jgi:hypothetical protein
MEALGYGEDALTIWALQNQLDNILLQLNDYSKLCECKVFLRPSFGRGNGKYGFGEFDFILLTENQLFLGESKWDRFSNSLKRNMSMTNVQLKRHDVFTEYVQEWYRNNCTSGNFYKKAGNVFNIKGKSIAPEGSLLSSNLLMIMTIIEKHFQTLPVIRNVLLYLYDGNKTNGLPNKSLKNFDLVYIDYHKGIGLDDNFVRLNL